MFSNPGPGGQKGFSFDPKRVGGTIYVGTHRIGDPKWRGPQGTKLRFQVLSADLIGLDSWRWRIDLERFRANAKVRGLRVTPALERRYLAWLKRIEERQARNREKAASQAARYAKRIAAMAKSRNWPFMDPVKRRSGS